jgi:hypothetical protein
LPDDEAVKIATGELDPITKEEYKDNDFSNDSTAESADIGYTKSKLPQLMREKSNYDNEAQFWSLYNTVRKREEKAGLIKPREKKGKKSKNSDEEPQKSEEESKNEKKRKMKNQSVT